MGTTLRAKAIYALRGRLRWIISGTPIQNKWEDLASLLNFLRVYPDQDIRSLTTMLRHGGANPVLRGMLASLCLRRSKLIIDLPSRRDTTHKVDFDAEEANLYNSINLRVTGFLEQQANQTTLRSYSNILTKINSLRHICNLGTCYRDRIGKPENQTSAMQELFDGLISAGAAECCICGSDVSQADRSNESENSATYGFESSEIRIATCGELICASCFAVSETMTCPSNGRCQYQSLCTLSTVNSSPSSDLSAVQPSSRLSTKMRALQEDLFALPETDKRYLFMSAKHFPFSHVLPVLFSHSGLRRWILSEWHWIKSTYPTLVLTVRCLPSKGSWPSKASSKTLVSVQSSSRYGAVPTGT